MPMDRSQMFGKGSGTIPLKENLELCVNSGYQRVLYHDVIFSGGFEVPSSNHGSERSREVAKGFLSPALPFSSLLINNTASHSRSSCMA